MYDIPDSIANHVPGMGAVDDPQLLIEEYIQKLLSEPYRVEGESPEGDYSWSGPSRSGAPSPQNVALANQLLELSRNMDRQDVSQSEDRLREEMQQKMTHPSGGGSITYGGQTEEVAPSMPPGGSTTFDGKTQSFGWSPPPPPDASGGGQTTAGIDDLGSTDITRFGTAIKFLDEQIAPLEKRTDPNVPTWDQRPLTPVEMKKLAELKKKREQAMQTYQYLIKHFSPGAQTQPPQMGGQSNGLPQGAVIRDYREFLPGGR